MSSCCLAACGRLAENSQSGEAALTLCGRALPAHLHPVLWGWRGEGALHSAILSPASPHSCAPTRGCRGSPQPTLCTPSAVPPTHLFPSSSSRWIGGSGQHQRPCWSLPWCVPPFPCPGQYFQAGQSQRDVRLVLLVSAGLPARDPECHFQVSFACFGSPGMAPGVLAEVWGTQSCGWQHWEKNPIPRDLLWMPLQCGITRQLRVRDVMEELCAPWAAPAWCCSHTEPFPAFPCPGSELCTLHHRDSGGKMRIPQTFIHPSHPGRAL